MEHTGTTRFWYATGVTPNLGDNGFLSDPENEYAKYFNPGLKPLQAFSAERSILLLGEPGLGKSTDILREFERVRSAALSGVRAFLIDLALIGSSADLQSALCAPEITDSLKSSGEVVLFLDGLDECLLNVRVAVPLLLDVLKRWPPKKVRVRISCRAAELPTGLAEGIKSALGDEPATVLHLAPFRRRDAVSMAKLLGIDDADAFVEKIINLDAVPLAIYPITLRLLIESFKADGGFPATRRELYLRGLRALCRDPRDKNRPPLECNNPDEILATAARIAAISVFSNRTSVGDEALPNSVLEFELTGSTERCGTHEFDVTPVRIHQVLRTALFRNGGRWAHRTYSEFLAAWYVANRQLPSQTAISLIVHPIDPEGRTIPQLHETAAWLSSMCRPVYDYVLRHEPELLLSSDTAAMDDVQKEDLIDELLKRAACGDPIFRVQHTFFGLYSRLNHPRLALQIGPWLKDRNRATTAREAACEIARECSLIDLLPDLVNIALDSTESKRARASALWAIKEHGTDSQWQMLRSLALGIDPSDSDREFQPIALQCAWPKHVTVSEMFQALTRHDAEDKERFYYFIHDRLGPGLLNEDLPVALAWVASQQHRSFLPLSFGYLVDTIVTKAWSALVEHPEFAGDFAKAVLSRIEMHDLSTGRDDRTLLPSIQSDPGRRRSVIANVVRLLVQKSKDMVLLLSGGRGLIISDDAIWLLRNALRAEDAATKRVYLELACRFIDPTNPEHMTQMYLAVHSDPMVAAICSWRLDPIPLDSPIADDLRAMHNAQFPKTPKPIAPDRLLAAIDATLNKQAEWWQCVIAELYRADADAETLWIGSKPLWETPGWIRADELTRARVLDAAKHFIRNADPVTEKWIGTGQIYNTCVWGHAAFKLLLREDPQGIQQLEQEHWQRWGATNVHLHHIDAQEDALLKLNYSKAKNAIIDAFSKELEGEIARSGVVINRVSNVLWDQNFEPLIVSALNDRRLQPHSRSTLLNDLSAHAPKKADDVVRQLLRDALQRGDREESAALAAMFFGSPTGWEVVWPLMQSNEDLGRAIIETAAYGQAGIAAFKAITEQQLAELYVWLVRRYPYVERIRRGVYSVSHYDSAEMFRDSVLEILKNRQTYLAVESLRWVQQQLPQLTWLDVHIRAAEEQARIGTWMPPSPATVYESLLNRRKRLIQSAADLRSAVIESLGRLQAELKAETPAVDDLWDDRGGGRFRPKDENHLSNYVKRYLCHDLPNIVVAGREVEIEGSYGVQGENTDIHIVAVITDSNSQSRKVTVIVESKCCWNAKLWSDMREQLAERYLSHGTCSEGIYLVGWYNCATWDETDRRNKRAPKTKISEVIEKLRDQASDLSRGPKHVTSFVLDCGLPAHEPNPRKTKKIAT